MVTKWGLSEKLGPLAYSKDEGEVFLGHSVTQHKNMSDETAHAIDEEVRSIIEWSYDRAKSIVDSNRDKLHMMAEALMKYETIESDQIDDIMAGITPRAPKGWSEDERRGPPKPDVKTTTPEAGKSPARPMGRSGDPPACTRHKLDRSMTSAKPPPHGGGFALGPDTRAPAVAQGGSNER